MNNWTTYYQEYLAQGYEHESARIYATEDYELQQFIDLADESIIELDPEDECYCANIFR
jgi:hypothetical protein